MKNFEEGYIRKGVVGKSKGCGSCKKQEEKPLGTDPSSLFFCKS